MAKSHSGLYYFEFSEFEFECQCWSVWFWQMPYPKWKKLSKISSNLEESNKKERQDPSPILLTHAAAIISGAAFDNYAPRDSSDVLEQPHPREGA